jgi:hypothetical protein
MRKFLIAGLSLLTLYDLCANEELDQITYESLSRYGCSDHVGAFRQLLELQKIDAFLEFGLGLGTKFYLDNCTHVTSAELVIKDRYTNVMPWYFDCVELFKDYSNWSPSLHLFTQVVNDANDLAVKNVDPESFDDQYLQEINRYLDGLFENRSYDVVFVDPGIHIRGDIVNALFGRVAIIAAHDTNFNSACYGWYKIDPPPTYEVVTSTYGEGTTFWILKEKRDLIAKLKKKLEAL